MYTIQGKNSILRASLIEIVVKYLSNTKLYRNVTKH